MTEFKSNIEVTVTADHMLIQPTVILTEQRKPWQPKEVIFKDLSLNNKLLDYTHVPTYILIEKEATRIYKGRMRHHPWQETRETKLHQQNSPISLYFC